MTVDFRIGFLAPPEEPFAFPGGEGTIRIAIDGEVLTESNGVDPSDSWEALYDATGEQVDDPTAEFTGEYLDFLLSNLQEALVRFQSGDFDRYEEVPAKVSDPTHENVFVLSFVDGERVRIAYQPLEAQFYTLRIPDAALRGYIVDPDDLCRELADCYREWKRFIDNAYPDHPDFRGADIPEFKAELDERISELEALVGEE